MVCQEAVPPLDFPGYAVVVGGVNIDIGGRANKPLLRGDSNPGKVHMSLGGVGRNIAHNMALLGCDVKLLTVLGDDRYAQEVVASCCRLGIDISQALTVAGEPTSIYLFIAGSDGDMVLAVSDMELCQRLTPAYLQTRLSLLNDAKVIVVDANLPTESIAWLCENVRVPIFADPVSVAKAEKFRRILGKLHTLKPNRMEAERLSGVPIQDEASLKRATDALLETGLRRVFLSLGEDGVYAADYTGSLRLPCCPAEPKSTTGAGDAFMGALAWAYLEGAGLEQSARLAQAAAAITVEELGTINPAMNAQAVKMRVDSGPCL